MSRLFLPSLCTLPSQEQHLNITQSWIIKTNITLLCLIFTVYLLHANRDRKASILSRFCSHKSSFWYFKFFKVSTWKIYQTMSSPSPKIIQPASHQARPIKRKNWDVSWRVEQAGSLCPDFNDRGICASKKVVHTSWFIMTTLDTCWITRFWFSIPAAALFLRPNRASPSSSVSPPWVDTLLRVGRPSRFLFVRCNYAALSSPCCYFSLHPEVPKSQTHSSRSVHFSQTLHAFQWVNANSERMSVESVTFWYLAGLEQLLMQQNEAFTEPLSSLLPPDCVGSCRHIQRLHGGRLMRAAFLRSCCCSLSHLPSSKCEL